MAKITHKIVHICTNEFLRAYEKKFSTRTSKVKLSSDEQRITNH